MRRHECAARAGLLFRRASSCELRQRLICHVPTLGSERNGRARSYEPLLTARTSGKRCTSAIKFASNVEVLSLLHAKASRSGIFKSTTGKMTTFSGATPVCSSQDPSHAQTCRHETEDRCFVQSILNDAGRLQTAAITFAHHAVVEGRTGPSWKPDERNIHQVAQGGFS